MEFTMQRFVDDGYLKDQLQGFVPSAISYTIISDIIKESSVLRLCKVEPMTTESKKFSVFSGGVGAYWVNETDRIETSTPSWIFPEITAKKLAVIIPVTREKINDAAINVFDELKPLIVESFYKAIDAACIFGISSPFARSIYSSALASNMAIELGTNTMLDLDVSDIMSLIEVKGYEVTGFISDISFKNQLRKLRDANGNQLYIHGLTDKNGTRYDGLYSLPIEFCRNGSWDSKKAVCIGGNWGYAVAGIREQIEYEILRESTLTTVTMADGKPLSLAEQDMVAIKATMRLGFLPVKEDAFAVLVPKGAPTTIKPADSEP